MTWLGFAGVFAAFFATHSLPTRPRVRDRLMARLGPGGFTLAYSVLSLAMLLWLIRAAGAAPFVMLWPQAPWQIAVVHAGMLAVCLIVALSVARPNPFSFGGAGAERFDPDRPGIVRWFRHPLLVALAAWAGLHLLPNGDLAHLLLFGVLGSFALAGRGLIDRRKRRRMGAEVWADLRTRVTASPMLPRPASWRGALVRIAAGGALYLTLVWLHPLIAGVTIR